MTKVVCGQDMVVCTSGRHRVTIHSEGQNLYIELLQQSWKLHFELPQNSSSSSVRFVMFFLSECGASVLCTYASGNCGTRKDCQGLERANLQGARSSQDCNWDLHSPWTVLRWKNLMLSEVVMRIAEGSHSLTSLRVPARRHTF